jgi:hypothetical protein
LTLLDVAWRQHSSADGVAQNEIWAATRSDTDLAALVAPVQMAHVEQTREAHARMMASAGIFDRALSDALLTLNVSALRGLAMEKAVGRGDAQIEAAVAQLRVGFAAIIKNARESRD